jgi:hypothetical protein
MSEGMPPAAAIGCPLPKGAAPLPGCPFEAAAAACLADHDIDQVAEAPALAQELHDTLRLPVWPVLGPLHERLLGKLDAVTWLEPRISAADDPGSAALPHRPTPVPRPARPRHAGRPAAAGVGWSEKASCGVLIPPSSVSRR